MNTENGNGLVPVTLPCEATRLPKFFARPGNGSEDTKRRDLPTLGGDAGRTADDAGAEIWATRGCARHSWFSMIQFTNSLDAGGPQAVFRFPINLAEPPRPTTPSAKRRPTTSTGASRMDSYPGSAAPPRRIGAGALAPRAARTEVMA